MVKRVRSDAESIRLEEDARRAVNWKRWGPYLAERQWGTVREDYSPDGGSWDDFTHDHARSRAYRWGEDGLLGICDRQARLCFAIALWNERDPILKERLFGLTGPEGNHGEDVKELYYYLDATPTHSYLKALYKYPQRAFPYSELVAENRRRGRIDGEYELIDTGVFDGEAYFDVTAEFAKADADDILIRITIANRGTATAKIHVLPTLWFRNTWSWGRSGPEYWSKPVLQRVATNEIVADHESLGRFRLIAAGGPEGLAPDVLFTENESNAERLWGVRNASPWVKDAFHEHVVNNRMEAVNPEERGTKAAFRYELEIPAGAAVILRLRLCADADVPAHGFGSEFEETFADRIAEADAFYASRTRGATPEEANVIRQAYAGLIWSKQFYHYVVPEWLSGDPSNPPPPEPRRYGRNHDWKHLHNRDVLSMPDKWEYPWYAAWDLAFHMVAMARIDAQFAKDQLLLLLREWYMHPNGQIPAYEFAFGDVNPPVHAWACWRVYKMTGPRGARDRAFLERCFHKLLVNFTWWVNRKDIDGNHLFAGGFLGLDNIGVFDRSQPLPTGGHLEQADGTAWMAFYASTMLAMALELAAGDPSYEDIASKFFEHFVAIADAMTTLGGTGLWDERDGFFYDQLHLGSEHIPLRLRSLVGLVPLLACETITQEQLDRLPHFAKRLRWFIANRPELSRTIACMQGSGAGEGRLLAIPSRNRLERLLRYMLDENEFLAPNGIRSLSQVYGDRPYTLHINGSDYQVAYLPAESNSGLFGGNSNWRGPVWFPLNFLLIEALERYHHFYGDSLRVEYPTGSGSCLDLAGVANALARRLVATFLPDEAGHRPCHGGDPRYAQDPHWKDLVLFHEYFCGDGGRGIGASHQTGWTALVARLAEDVARARVADHASTAASDEAGSEPALVGQSFTGTS